MEVVKLMQDLVVIVCPKVIMIVFLLLTLAILSLAEVNL